MARCIENGIPVFAISASATPLGTSAPNFANYTPLQASRHGFAAVILLNVQPGSRLHRKDCGMTSLDVVFRYGAPPTEGAMRAVDSVREVYGIRRIQFNGKEHTLRVEFDASRLNDNTVAALLRRAGIDVRDRIALA